MKPTLPKSVDVVVVGGGIIGVSTAYYLARKGVSVALCEKGRIAGEQSSRNWGFVRKQGRNPLELPLMMMSQGLWDELVPQMPKEVGFHRGGTLYLSDDEKRYEANQAWLVHAKEFDLDTKFLTLKELQELIPDIKQQKMGALFTPSDGRAEPQPATEGIAELARSAGAMIFEQTAVRGLELSAGSVSGVVTESGTITASTVVLAGGAWSSLFLRQIDVVFPQLKVIGSVMATEPGPLVAQQSIWSNGLGLRRRYDGGYTVAYGGSFDCEITPDYLRFFRQFIPMYRASKEEVSIRYTRRFFTELGWSKHPDLGQVSPYERERALDPAPNVKLLDQARERLKVVFPALGDVPIRRRWAGMIDATPDELPVIGAIDQVPGLVVSSGYSGHGFGIGPGAGKVTAELAMGATPSVNLDGFRFERFLR